MKNKNRRNPGNPLILFVCGLALFSGSSQAQDQEVQSIFLIRSPQIVDVETGSLVSGQDVLIENGRITAIGVSMQQGSDTRVVDGEGLFLTPGLWDMHAHIRHPRAADLILPQFIANGVTGVREMSSECDNPDGGEFCLAKMQEWRGAIDDGELPGPRLLALSSFPVNPPWDYAVTEEQIRGLVAEMDNRGVDLIKTYFRLSPEAFAWLMDEADNRGLDVAGHLPMAMTALEASELGLRSLEHARDFLFDCYPGSGEFRGTARTQNPDPAIKQQMVTGYNREQCQQTFAAFARNQTWYVPTHVTRRMDALASDPGFRNDDRLRYIWSEVRESWQADADAMAAQADSTAAAGAMRGFYEKGLEITGQAHAAGVRILAGTDSGDTYSFFGFSLHDELEELVKAGLSPADALAAATISAAEFLRLDDSYGSIAEGKAADLLLLRANPLTDIANSREIETVILNGRLYDREALDSLLQEVETAITEL